MKACLDDSGMNHLIEEVTEARGLGTRQLHGALPVRLGTEEHGGPYPALSGKSHQNTINIMEVELFSE